MSARTTTRTGRVLACALSSLATLGAVHANATESEDPSSDSGTDQRKADTLLEVRVAFSDSATALFDQRRFRQYLSIELDDVGHVAARGSGPLADHIAYIWIDIPEPNRVAVQTRIGRASVATRFFPVREGLRPDVVARLVAIGAADMIRSRTQSQSDGQPQAPEPPTDEQVEAATRDSPALLFEGRADAAWIPSASTVLGGASLELAFRFQKVRPFFTGSLLMGNTHGNLTRWASVGIGADRTFWVSPRLRLSLGCNAHAATVHLSNHDYSEDSWTARASARLHTELAIHRATWIGISIEPGMLLRPASFDTPSGPHSLHGFHLSASLSLQWERRSKLVVITPATIL